MRIMSQTSLLAFGGRIQPTMTEREAQVMEVIEELYPTTLENVAKQLNVPEHTISGRITGLKKKGLIGSIRREHNSRMNMVDVYAPKKQTVEFSNE